MSQEKITPLMSQYFEIKKQYENALVLFQVGDFYELFFDDAQRAAAALGIALTKRGTFNGEPIPLCGVPLHALDHYLVKLIKQGFCVVICDQLEAAVAGKIVKRGVRQVLTPGTLTDTRLLDEKSASYVCSFFEHEQGWAVVFAEILTAQWYATLVPVGAYKILEAELSRFFPDEIVLDEQGLSFAHFSSYFKKQGYYTGAVQTGDYDPSFIESVEQKIKESLDQSVPDAIEKKVLSQALHVLCAYLKKNNEAALRALQQIYFYRPDDFMIIDQATQKNLELLCNAQDGTRHNSLLSVLDMTTTAMGARTLKKWLVRPLVQKTIINARFDAIEYFKNNFVVAEQIMTLLKTVGDGERSIGRIALDRAPLHDYVHLIDILKKVPEIKQFLQHTTPLLHMLSQSLAPCLTLGTYLEAALSRDALIIINQGFDMRLDQVRSLVHDSHSALMALEKKEQELTGITSLKIRYTDAFGYAIEITNTHKEKIPVHYIRKQTLVGRERYTCVALQELEHAIVQARAEIVQLEQQLFVTVKKEVTPFIHDLRKTMQALAHIDALLSFARCAYERNYRRPIICDGRDIIIEKGRHPVVEGKVGSGFVPNDTRLTDEQALWIITGPNMGGKSTYLRQVALICCMAQCGSFVPAHAAQLPLLDRIFTRIGASDNVAEGKSTFLVEMEETAHICQFATDKSLVILDEVGRGTSTFDGVSIAQALVEYMYTTLKSRCLFATHYHELTALATTFSGIINVHAASRNTAQGIVFLHMIVPGIAQGSFGISVAKLAHLPNSVVQRAYQIEQYLSQSQNTVEMPTQDKRVCLKPEIHVSDDERYSQLEKQVELMKKKLEVLDGITLDDLSPKKAFDVVWKLKELD